MLSSISDGVFFIRWGNDNNADDAMDDCKSFRSYQMLGSISDSVFFIRWGNDNNADDAMDDFPGIGHAVPQPTADGF